MRILLARHGETTANAEARFQGIRDYPLTARGRQQAERLAAMLAYHRPGRIYTSDLTRSRETAQPAARLLAVEPIALPVFREFSWGVLEGLTRTEIKERYPALFSRLQTDWRRAVIPGQEPLPDFRRRLQAGLAVLLAPDNPSTVALIGHGRYLNALLVEFLGLDFAGPWPFSFLSGALTILEVEAGQRRLLCFNQQN
ncbi:MAG: histidine phosphatase family protein [Dethiobacteraceae bacterium]|jgi:probable phosphoglycerate mutase|nr:histidine phosphatase family protein [Bacillota bacterium]